MLSYLQTITNGKSGRRCQAQAYIDTHCFFCAIIQVIELLRQSICYLTLRKEKSMLLHYPRNSSPANGTRQFKKTAFKGQSTNKSQKIEHEVQQSRDTRLSITEGGMCFPINLQKQIIVFMNHTRIAEESSTKGKADCVFQAVQY